jgi:hypothetical protein
LLLAGSLQRSSGSSVPFRSVGVTVQNPDSVSERHKGSRIVYPGTPGNACNAL